MLFNPLLNNNGRYALAAGLLLAVVGVIATSVTATTLRASTQSAFNRVQNKNYTVNHHLLDYKNANSTLFDATTALSIDETLRPFGPDILNGYDTCDDFEADVVKVLIARGKNYIQSNLNTSCGDNGDHNVFKRTYHKNRRATRKESSFGTNNQVSDVEEIDLIKSDGSYIYIGQYDKIFVSDLNGNVVENITVRSPGATSLELASIFFHENILTALASIQICPDQVTPCYGSTDAFVYQFNLTAETLKCL